MLGGDVLNGHNRNHVQGEQKENWRLVVFIYSTKKWIREYNHELWCKINTCRPQGKRGGGFLNLMNKCKILLIL